jgi:hypothetical protein
MAAGQGFKTFTSGEVLTAADVNGYLMQGVGVFADATERDAEITSPQEGQFAYLKDTNVTTYYTGSAWANLDTTGMTNPMTTTGDTIYSSSGSTPARLGIGTAGQVLQVNSGATAPEWATPAGGSTDFTLLNAGGTNLTGAGTITVSITAYNNIYVFVQDASSASANSEMSFRLNGDSGSNYRDNAITFTNPVSAFATNNGDTSLFMFGKMGSLASNLVTGSLQIFGAKSATGLKPVQFVGAGNGASSGSPSAFIGQALYLGTSAITSVSVISGTGNFDGGKIFVYGAN